MTSAQINKSLCIVCENNARLEAAKLFAAQHALPFLDASSSDYELQLRYTEEHIELFDVALNASIYVDFITGALAHRKQFGGGRGQAIAKAMGLKRGHNPSILDITAGLARDAYILRILGCAITLVERSPVLHALIEDGIQRGQTHEDTATALSQGFGLINNDSIGYMKKIEQGSRPDVIYIDPMYPERKKSALVKKDMQILQKLLGEDDNAEQLLDAALSCAQKRVVLKRPIHADCVGSIKPDTSVSSKKTRYDIYII